MMSIPVPFVVAMLLTVLVLMSHHRLKETATGQLFAVVLWLYITSEILIGLRWLLNAVWFMPIAAGVTVSGIVLLYLAFASLGRHGPVVSAARDWPHFIPVALTLCSALASIPWVEFILIATKVTYAWLLMQQARRAPDSLKLVRLGWLKDTQRALWGVVFLLLFSLLVDGAIVIDFAYYHGQHSAQLVGFANLVMLLPMGLACVIAGGDSVVHMDDDTHASPQDATPTESTTAVNEPESGNDATVEDEQLQALLGQLNTLLIGDKLYSDTELNLQKLARKAGVPSRAVSRAINSQTGLNMSQWVNNARIEAVCAMLKDSEISVAQAMFDAGFTTKSNFNREFRRVTGSSPSAWREENRVA